MAATGGVLLAVVGPPTSFVPGVWLAPAALYGALVLAAPLGEGRGRFRRFVGGGAMGFAFGFACNVMTFRFVPDVIVRFTPLPWVAGAMAVVLLAWAQGLRYFVLEHLYRAMAKRRVPPVVAFGVATYLSTFVPMIFPWTPAGGATAWPVTVQLAELCGERFLTGLFAVLSALLVEALRHRRTPRRATYFAGGAALIATALMVYGSVRIRAVEAARKGAPAAAVALVQPSIEARERWEKGRAAAILTKLTDLTKRAEAAGAELVVWPEAAYPYSLSATGRRAPVGSYAPLQAGVRGPVLTGALTHKERDAMNSAVVIHGDGTVSEPYHKMHLLWFGETVPLADVWPWVRKTFARGTGLVPGEAQLILPAGNVRAAVLNCFEDTVPAAGREAGLVSPNLLVNITNDAWFAGSQESALHLRVAVMRSVETRRDMVRAVNHGPTSWVAATGRIAGVIEPTEPSFLMAKPALLELPATVYVRFGETPWVLMSVAAAALLVARARGRRSSPT